MSVVTVKKDDVDNQENRIVLYKLIYNIMLYWMPSVLLMVRDQKPLFFVNMVMVIADVTSEMSAMTFSETTKFFHPQSVYLCTYSYNGKN